MKEISALFTELDYRLIRGALEGEAGALVYDTRKVTKNCLFVCIKGLVYDSHEHITEIADAGARYIVVERPVEAPDGVTLIEVKDTRYALAILSAAWFDWPARRMKVIGVTGTKGKTTTTFMIKGILEHAGYRVGLIGTIEAIIGDEQIPADNTTPESYLIQEYFARMVDAGCEICVMEVSSQGLMMHRTAGIPFEIGIFTNLVPDHIGPNEHASFEEYAACKGLLFRQCRHGIANIDDENFDLVLNGHTCDLETIGFSEQADYRASDMELLGGEGYLGVK
ncbi:MAG: UDP-N-acetylmuramoyl-L-alanyl-D-glutamate--2,6-diaminopimelate ligase, partial [Lachnospiraceae bacterium]|nr:UDP-N-acetylmuramoyl-L-alanyl-D-glutamate--2,6-diaminopimelate ligase [Lachnospiraceae bacterium]